MFLGAGSRCGAGKVLAESGTSCVKKQGSTQINGDVSMVPEATLQGFSLAKFEVL